MTNINANGGAFPRKSVGVAYTLWLFLGFFGVHRFYLGRVGSGLIYLFTFGLCGIGLIYDLFVIPRMVREENMLNGNGFGGVNQNSNQNQQVININMADLQQPPEQKQTADAK